MAGTAELRRLLAATTLPAGHVDMLLAGASPIWLLSAPAAVLATDLVLSHPPLGAGEIRAVVHPRGDDDFRLTVLGRDRAGFLADSAAVLVLAGLAVNRASVISWPRDGLALHALDVHAPGWDATRWSALGMVLRTVNGGRRPDPTFVPAGRAEATSTSQAMGRCLVTLRAPDQLGLLWATCRWFADRDVSIEAASAESSGGHAIDQFLVTGQPDVAALAADLSFDEASVRRVEERDSGRRRHAAENHAG